MVLEKLAEPPIRLLVVYVCVRVCVSVCVRVCHVCMSVGCVYASVHACAFVGVCAKMCMDV
jgi:hypothetical protein